MTEKNKGRSGGDRPTPSASEHLNPTGTNPLPGRFSDVESNRIFCHFLLREAIVRLALWGLIPASIATWLTQWRGKR